MIPVTTLESLQGREWLETNGRGGFASSTPIGLNTRRYHGLLFAATRPPVGRTLLLAKYEETLIIEGERFALSTNRYGDDVVHLDGYQYLTAFHATPVPVSVFEVSGITLNRTVFLVHG